MLILGIILGLMNENDDIRKGRHCVYDLHVHLVFVTKYRHDVFTSEHLTALEHVFADVCRSFDCRLEEFNGETDHVHLLPELARHYWRAQRLWSPSYYAGTNGGAPLDTLKRYIENQNQPE